MATGTRVSGLKQALANLSKLGLDVDDFKETFGSIASRGADIAAGFVNSRSGKLAGSVRGNRAKNRSVVMAGRGKTRNYAGVQNYGWPRRNIPAQRFMQRADDQLKPRLPAMLENELQDKIRRRGLG
jgi:phage gpG-like protein